jgi:DNA polymerase-1
LEVREDAVEQVRGMLKQIMENVTKTSVPMVVDVGVGDNWHAAH